MLREMKLLPDRPARPNEFIEMRFRPFMPKMARRKASKFGEWRSLVHMPFAEHICPVRATVIYLHKTFRSEIRPGVSTSAKEVLNPTDDHGRDAVEAAPLFVSLRPDKREGALLHNIRSNTISGIARRHGLPEDTPVVFVPYVIRSTSASYKLGYGATLSEVLTAGGWSSHAAFEKHYRLTVYPPVNPRRVADAQRPEWKLGRAHLIVTRKISPPPVVCASVIDHNMEFKLAQRQALQARTFQHLN